MPMMGCQSTIDRPLPVSLVTPPTMTMPKMVAQVIRSQATTIWLDAVKPLEVFIDVFVILVKIASRSSLYYLGSHRVLPLVRDTTLRRDPCRGQEFRIPNSLLAPCRQFSAGIIHPPRSPPGHPSALQEHPSGKHWEEADTQAGGRKAGKPKGEAYKRKRDPDIYLSDSTATSPNLAAFHLVLRA